MSYDLQIATKTVSYSHLKQAIAGALSSNEHGDAMATFHSEMVTQRFIIDPSVQL